MATFYQANVTATNGSAFVTVNSSGDDIGILRERSFLQIGTNRIVEVKAGIPGSPDQIELAETWPFATVTADAIAAPTAGDLAEAVEQIRALTSQGSTILADALLKSGNLAGLANAAAARGNLGLEDAATRAVMSSLTDTTAGRLMPVGAFGLGGQTSVTGDFNSIDVTRFFSNTNYDPASMPPVTSGIYSGLNIMDESGRHLMFVGRTDINEPRFWGRVSDGTTFSDYVEFYTTDNILGTVSQSGGVPTGAIIERGSNANGEYVKFADGSVFMVKEENADIAIDTAVGSVFRSASQTWDYPVSISPANRHAPDVNNRRGDREWWGVNKNVPDGNSADYLLYSATSKPLENQIFTLKTWGKMVGF